MATMNCKKYFVPQIVDYVGELKKKAAEVKDNPILDQQNKFLEGMANMICSFIFKECASNKALDDSLAYEYKSAERCINFVVKKAMELNSMKASMLWVPDSTVFSWITEYYMLDDKAEYEKEKAEALERERKAEENAKKRAERDAKRAESEIKKAVKAEITNETVRKCFSNIQPSTEVLTLIGAEQYAGENIIREDNVEVRETVIKLAVKAINDKKVSLTGVCGKYKLSKERLAEIEAEVRERISPTPDDEDEEIEDEDFDELGFVS